MAGSVVAALVAGLGVVGIVDSGRTAGAAPLGEIRADCGFSHRLRDDPIVYPGRPGVAHSHDFFGPRTTNARSTPASLYHSATTCDPTVDKSAYWFPTLYVRGVPITPERSTFYYTAQQVNPRVVRPYPFGLKMLAGDPTRRGATGPSRYKWSCLGSPTSSTGNVPLCPAGSKLELLLDFPDCWDGARLDSTDHRAHVAYSAAKVCPRTHPVAIPRLQFKLRWPTRGGAATTLSSGNGYSAHGDFVNAWQPSTLASRVRTCLHAQVKCANDGTPM